MLKRLFLALMFICLFSALVIAGNAGAAEKNPVVQMETTLGTVKIELYPAKAPLSVKNFLDYVNSGFYNGTIFHRVMPGFMIQGGGFTADRKQKETRAPIKNEADNGLTNDRGTIAMARTASPDSATSQFFINVVDKIAATPTTSRKGQRDVPVEPIVIHSARRE